jgi:hypothetical protein
VTDETVRKRYPDAVIEVSLFEDLVASALAEVAFSELIENAVKHAEGEVPTSGSRTPSGTTRLSSASRTTVHRCQNWSIGC